MNRWKLPTQDSVKRKLQILLKCLYSTPGLLVYKLMYLTIVSNFLQSAPFKKKKKKNHPVTHGTPKRLLFRAMFPAWQIWSRFWAGVGIRTSKQTDNM